MVVLTEQMFDTFFLAVVFECMISFSIFVSFISVEFRSMISYHFSDRSYMAVPLEGFI
ncbi:MAG: hypothetical protein ACLFSM_07485 [Thermoplasmata archaeon]